MCNKRIIDLSKEFSDLQQDIQRVDQSMKNQGNNNREITVRIDELQKELEELGIVPMNTIEKDYSYFNEKVYSIEDILMMANDIEKEVTKEINNTSNINPQLSKLDIIMASIIGSLGVLVDVISVKIPENINYLQEYEQKGSKINELLRSVGIDENGELTPFLKSLERNNKVSFDASTKDAFKNYKRDISGFYPKTHRLMSLGHDPFFGLFFGTLDIVNGSITLIDSKGAIHNIPIERYMNNTIKDKVAAPLVWMGHVLSDVCTKMGIPVPGWGFTQLLQFGNFGRNDKTFAEVARWMYIEGYDLRHFLNMSTVPAVIELLSRIYYKCTVDGSSPGFELTYQKDLKEIHNNIRLQKILFIAHSVAMGGNVGKIVLARGNPLAFNYSEMLFFVKQSMQMIQLEMRDKETEKVIRNRDTINNIWSSILDLD